MDKYLIDGHKLYWHLDRLSRWQKERVIPPLYLEVSPVGYCNHKCLFCGIDFAMQNKAELEAGIFCRRLAESGKLGVKSIMFAGEGEPFLHKDFSLFVKTAKKADIDVSITTNGTAGTRQAWQEVLPHLTWLRFSIDAGTPEVYTKVHNVAKAYFNKAVTNIKQAIWLKRKQRLKAAIGIQFLVIQENSCDIESAIKLFSALGADYISFKPYSVHPQMINKRDTIYTEAMIEDIANTIGKYQGKIKTNIIFRKDAMKRYMEKEKAFGHCRSLPFWGYISSRGDFYTCSVFIGDKRFRAGNIYGSDMKAIFYGRRRRASIAYGEKKLNIKGECRLNCRMARINEFLEFLDDKPEHVNFI